ncbi:MAG: hypothetical protein HXY25_05445 [Alphaproteobacteria bacterium]|nr:hypothetical protein [Alphaproteobacteria bacterium]
MTCPLPEPARPERPPLPVLEDGGWVYTPLARAFRKAWIARTDEEKVAVLAFRRWTLSLFLLTGLGAGIGGIFLTLLAGTGPALALLAAAAIFGAVQHERELRLLLRRLEGPFDALRLRMDG